MKKIIGSIFTLIALSLLIGACSGDSYGKRLDKEKKAIKNFIADNEIKVIREYPDHHKFGKNEYYLEGSTGVYFRVESMGDTTKAVKKGQITLDVTLRIDSVQLLVSSDTAQIANNYPGFNPIRFDYGRSSTYLDLQGSSSINAMYMSPACVLPLEKGVGPGAIVDMIIPFVNGSSYQRNTYEPFKLTGMHYSYHLQVEDGSKNIEE